MTRHSRTWPRAGLFAALVATIAVAAPTFVAAGPGHDHGPAEVSSAGPASPRLVAVSETYEFVAILQEGKLTAYLDRMADTSPVIDAKVGMIVNGEQLTANPQPNGTFVLSSPAVNKPGNHEIIITIEDGEISDLLVGTLIVPDPGHDHYDHDHADHHKDESPGLSETPSGPVAEALETMGVSLPDLQTAPILAGLALAIGVMFGATVRSRTGLIIGIIGLVSVIGAGVAFAGPGHDHGEGGATAAKGDAPRRLPDGELFLPKPTQRLLGIRTRILETETARSADRLIGRVISDPNRSGLVQSTIGGRIRATESGFPILGQRVEKGQILAFVEPAFSPIDASDVRQTAGDLEQRIAVLDARIARQRRLVAKEIASRANLEDLEIEREGLNARRDQLKKSRNEDEVLVAPVDGVIAEVYAAAGQVVASADTLFHIVDPQSLWVEAMSFDPAIDPANSGARARTPSGTLFELSFVGRSRTLQQQATVLHFRIDAPGEELNIGSPVKVLIEKGEPVSGLILPRSAIAYAPNGQMVVFKRLEPERYLPSAVKTENLDGERVHITAGLKPGDQVIVRAAPLVNQIR